MSLTLVIFWVCVSVSKFVIGWDGSVTKVCITSMVLLLGLRPFAQYDLVLIVSFCGADKLLDFVVAVPLLCVYLNGFYFSVTLSPSAA